ncbi:hypothetical protein CGRA01v4_07221 [Colletotrichum graminicola]|nr:hypothetical protein CGRA01v4_07221 [Colletotrichum graminicola]
MSPRFRGTRQILPRTAPARTSVSIVACYISSLCPVFVCLYCSLLTIFGCPRCPRRLALLPSKFLPCKTRRLLRHLQRDTSLVAPLTSMLTHPGCAAKQSVATALLPLPQ